MKLSILSWGGIGDTLRNIALIPHEALYRRFGIQCRVAYRHWRTTGALVEAEAPKPPILQELIGRIPSLVWTGESDEHRGMSRALNKALRTAVKLTHDNTPIYFPFTLQLTPEEEAILPKKNPHAPLLGIQTHLSGMRTKQWGKENWRQFLRLLHEACPHLEIILIDGTPQVTELCEFPNITCTAGWKLAQSISLISRLDYLISVDSWTKYAAAWNRVPQLVIVPDQTSDYSGLTAQKLVSCEFEGIVGKRENTLIGLTNSPSPELTLSSMAALTPAYLLERTLKALPRAKFTETRAKVVPVQTAATYAPRS